MSIGYACLTVGVPETNMRHCLMKNATGDRLMQIISENLEALENIIDYNIENNVKLFRISSDLIPFGSSPVNDITWWELYEEQFRIIGKKIAEHGIRVSMHPGQYTVLNSPHRDIVDRAVQDLQYHAKVLDSLRTGMEHKIVLHIGGVYQDKEMSMERFMTNYDRLPDSIKDRLVIENDDKSYDISEVMTIGTQCNIPVIFDNLHHRTNPADSDMQENDWINECKKTWQTKDGAQKIHYSQQETNKRPGSHSQTIRIKEFMDFYANLRRDDLDIMLEVKDKNLSAVKCINCTSKNHSIKSLQLEWNRFQYHVLERSPSSYIQMCNLLESKTGYPAVSFYEILENALSEPEVIENATHAAQHVWECLKGNATSSENITFLKKIQQYQSGKINLKAIKRFLWNMSQKYRQSNLENSYYFIL